jgi:hypothetical protein
MTTSDRELSVLEPSEPHAGAILICDGAHNDIAEFFHADHATVPQSYADALALAKGTAVLPDAMRTLRDAYTVLAFAFNRLHGSARSRDTELCGDIGKVRGKIEAVFRKAGERP